MRIDDTILTEAFANAGQYQDGLGGMKEYEQVVEHIAGGEKMLSSDVPAALAESRRMRMEISGMSQAVRNVQEAASIAGIAGDVISRVAPVISRMNQLAAEAAGSGCGDGRRQALDEEYRGLAGEMSAIVEEASFNDVPIFDGSHSRGNGGLIMQAGAGTGQVIAMYFEGPDREGLLSSSLRTQAEAEQAQKLLKRQMQVFAKERAGLSAYKKEIESQRGELEDMIAGLPQGDRLRGWDEAKEQTRAVISGMLARPTTAALAQAWGVKRENAEAALS